MTGGAGDDRPRDGDPLLLAPRQLVRGVARPIGKADLVQGLHGPPPAFGGRYPAVEQRQLDILQRRGAGEKIEALEDEADEVAAEQRMLVAVEIG